MRSLDRFAQAKLDALEVATLRRRLVETDRGRFPQVSRAPLVTRLNTDGPGSGAQETGRTRAASGLRSNIAVIRSVPPMPSTMQWCTFESSAQRPPSMPSSSHASQSGRSRSSRCAKTRPASWRSCRGRPGFGTAACRTW